MVLESQLVRPLNRRRHMYRRPRRRRRLALLGALVAVAGVLLAFKLFGGTPLALDPLGEEGEGTSLTQRLEQPKEKPVAERRRPPRGLAARSADGRNAPAPVVETRTPAQGSLASSSLSPGSRRPPPSEPLTADPGRPVRARRTLSAALAAGRLGPAEASAARDLVTRLNQRLVFSPEVVKGDPFSRAYVVRPGDRLGGIVGRESLKVDWRFIMRINGLLDERFLRAGQRLKLVTGPFHAVVDKSDFRLDLYLGSPPDRVFVASYPVGLGEFNSTPVGRFRVRAASKLVNPAWANPRTGERFGRHDPDNPIGERWIGLEGIDDANRDLAGYGIHGTIEPETVGRQSSMGCVRMLPEDVEVVYEVLMERISTVEIRP